MSPATIIMVVLICLGSALFLGALVYAFVCLLKLAKAGRQAGIESKDHVQEVIILSRGLAPKLRELSRKQKVVADTLQSVSATTSELSSLKDDVDRVTGLLPHRKP
jgi:hypothetical protein